MAVNAHANALAARAVAARRSAIREIFDAANGLDDVVRLEIGEPSFRTPAHIVDGALEAARAGLPRHTPHGRYASLRAPRPEKPGRGRLHPAPAAERRHTPRGVHALYALYLPP